MSNQNSEDINKQAAAWITRRDAADWSEVEEGQLQQWLQSSYRHRTAYLRLEYVWQKAGRLKALGAGYASGEVPPPGQWHRSPFAQPSDAVKIGTSAEKPRQGRRWPRKRRMAAIAAAVLLAIGAEAVWYGTSREPTYQTPVGAVETVAIADGSRVILNTDTQVRVALSVGERQVRLERGEAFFEVAKDPQRPFVVRAGPTSVTAVGTQFSVRRRGDDTLVVVTEGIVRIQNDTAPSVPEPQTVKAGQTARIRGASVLIQDETAARAQEHLSWRTGVLVFRDTRLEDAVAEFNRYNMRKILIADPALNDFRVAGSFRTTSTEAFVHLLAQGFPLHVEEHDDALVLVVD